MPCCTAFSPMYVECGVDAIDGDIHIMVQAIFYTLSSYDLSSLWVPDLARRCFFHWSLWIRRDLDLEMPKSDDSWCLPN